MTSELSLTEAYRPKTISDIVGQESAKRKVGAWLRTGRIPGSTLIAGEFSAGKTSLARIVAKAALCLNPDKGESCDKCNSCIAFDKTNHRDYTEMNSASDRGIDAMRNIASKIRMRPLLGKKKVLILDEAHGITSQGWGALLKPMEEPPPHMVLIMVTTNPEKIPKANLSRCNIITLNDFTLDDCTDLLQSVCERTGLGKQGITRDNLYRLSQATRGKPRSALHALDQIYTMVLDAQETETINDDLVNEFIQEVASSDVEASAALITRSILDGKVGKALNKCERCATQGDLILERITETMKQAMMRGIHPKLPDQYYADVFDGLAVFQLAETMPEAKTVLLDAYQCFTDITIRLSDKSLAASEVLAEPVARSAMLIQQLLKSTR